MMNQQPVLVTKLHVILQRSLVECRNLALGRNCEQLYDLADTFEVIPELMVRWAPEHLETVRARLRSYQSRYPSTAYDYLSILDMDDHEFQQVFRPAGRLADE